MHFVRQLLPLAVLFGFLGILSGGSTPALGNVTSISPVSSGSSITVTAVYTNSPAGTGASISAAGNGSFSAANASGGAGVQATGVGTKEIKTSPDTSGNTGSVITVTATFACQGNGPVSFLLLQVGASPNNQSASANCTGNSTTSGSGSLIINPNTQATGSNVTINATCSAGATLAASPEVGKFLTATVSGAAINVSGSSVTCVNGGSLSATYQCTQNGNTTLTLSGTLSASGSLACGTATNNAAGTSVTQSNGITLANPSNSGTSSPTSISISPELIPCGGSAQVSVTASLIANAPVQDGTVVNLYTTNGIIEPKQGVIKDGKFITTLKAPATGGVATVNASVGGITNNRDVKFDCSIGTGTTGTSAVVSTPAALPQTFSPPPPPPAAFPQSTGGIPIIAPPNTGDAGLKALLD